VREQEYQHEEVVETTVVVIEGVLLDDFRATLVS